MNCEDCKKTENCSGCEGCKHEGYYVGLEIEDHPEPCKTCLSEEGECKREEE